MLQHMKPGYKRLFHILAGETQLSWARTELQNLVPSDREKVGTPCEHGMQSHM